MRGEYPGVFQSASVSPGMKIAESQPSGGIESAKSLGKSDASRIWNPKRYWRESQLVEAIISAPSENKLGIPWCIHTSVASEHEQRQLRCAALFFAGQMSAKRIVPQRIPLQILGCSFQELCMGTKEFAHGFPVPKEAATWDK